LLEVHHSLGMTFEILILKNDLHPYFSFLKGLNYETEKLI